MKKIAFIALFLLTLASSCKKEVIETTDTQVNTDSGCLLIESKERFSTINYTYDAKRRLVKMTSTSMGTRSLETNYEYNELGLLIKEQAINYSNGVNTVTRTYEYNADKTLKFENISFDDGTLNKIENLYANGKLSEKKFYTGTKSTSANKYLYSYFHFYDTKGRIAKIDFGTTVSIYKYHDSGKLASHDNVCKFNEFLEKYDEKGNFIYGIEKELDRRTGVMRRLNEKFQKNTYDDKNLVHTELTTNIYADGVEKPILTDLMIWDFTYQCK